MKYFELLFQTLNPVLIGLEFESLGNPRSLATSSPVLAKWEEFSENLRCMGGRGGGQFLIQTCFLVLKTYMLSTLEFLLCTGVCI